MPNCALAKSRTLTSLFPEEVGVATVMAHIAVEHIVGHKRKASSVKKCVRERLIKH